MMDKQTFMIELDGIIGTIHTYSRNPFMLGYTKELRKAVDANDEATLTIVLDKLIDWYNQEISSIKNDDYIFNKHMHEKAYHILKNYRHSLHS